ncbi:c-type cytochrome [Cupriavidus agavae]|uniref:Mono/diheme cytochrome c family protein n=1 Tax=Cupriavidus agavae TaxID=1001822 RepID=A0A4Q7S7T6_9BURK|nr:c-type cytochrome [Cupriavidus agavae]RZT42435.1 mono/diheme cytochrome c family protein [Cupriavidus agavae]
MKKRASPRIVLLVIVLIAIGAFFALTAPSTWRLLHASRDLPDAAPPDLANGRTMFLAGDCATCHASPGKNEETLLGGGRALETPFGTFHMPNISPDPGDGIGRWTLEQFVTAMREGVLPDKGHAYPAFPYTSYQRMSANDLRDLFGYLQTLPPEVGAAPDHDLHFPYSMRRGVGLWRLMFLDGKPLDASVPDKSAAWHRGRALVEGPGHCVECHSPRNAMGAVPLGRRFSGGPNVEGTGYIPNITPDETGIGYWSVHDIARYLAEGVTPIAMKAGGDMKEVIANTSRLHADDRLAMAEYLKSLPPVDAPNAGQPKPNRTDEIVMLPAAHAAAGPSRLDALAASPDQQARAQALYVISPTPFVLAQAPQHTGEDGKLLGATRVTVLSRQEGWLQVRVDGWQVEGSDSVIYALPGQRILQAVLSAEAIASVQRLRTVKPEHADQSWHEVRLTVWIAQKGLSADLAQLWRHSDETFRATCATCHALPHPEDFLANQWIGTLGAMKRYTSLDDAEYRLLLSWLQYHAKDVGAAARGAKP